MAKDMVKIMNEFLHGPVWVYGAGEGASTEVYPLVLDDPIIRQLNEAVNEMYSGYFEFDSHDVACWFDEEQQKADKHKMLDLLGKLNARLAEINDGSFEVIDTETPYYESLP